MELHKGAGMDILSGTDGGMTPMVMEIYMGILSVMG
jgi:hypothetical protein